MNNHRIRYFQLRSILYGALLCSSSLPLTAGDDSPKDMKSDGKDMQVAAMTEKEKNWAVELSSGVLFSNIRTGNGNNYTLVPIQLAAVLKIDDVSLDNMAGGILRGNTEFLFRGDYYQSTFGQENRLAGVSVGPRYNFVQPGWKIVPFIEGNVGLLFADSNPQIYGDNQQRGLGQDFNFTMGAAAGVRYDITEDWYVRLSCNYVHVSNAALSEPQHQNKAIDALGPQVGVGYRF